MADHCQADPQLFVESQQMPSSTHRNDMNRRDAEIQKKRMSVNRKRAYKNPIRREWFKIVKTVNAIFFIFTLVSDWACSLIITFICKGDSAQSFLK